jgi:LacI family transcriptional regulator
MPRNTKSPVARVTVNSIAAHAGVSIGSVSSVLNNRHIERRISSETVERVRASAAKLGYLPNISARRLRSGGSAKNTVVLALVTSFEAPIPLVKHFIVALQKAVAAGSDHSFSLLIEMFHAGRLNEMAGLLTGDHFNAALIMNTTATDDAFLTRLHLPYPAVLVNRAIPGHASVVEAPTTGTRPAEILFRGKCRRLAVLHGSPLTQITSARVDAFIRRSAQLAGGAPAEIIAEDLSETAGYEALRAFLKSGGKCDGLYAVSDALALGAYRAIKERGLSIPDDVAVIGVGDYDIAPFFDPPLSCVGVSHRELAEQASALLLQQLARGAELGRTVLVPLVETLRASSGHRQ